MDRSSLREELMLMTLVDVRRIASEVISKGYPTLELLGVTTAEGGSRYSEIILSIRGCHSEPCQLIVGVNRDAPEAAFRRHMDERFREHLR
jgi:hypothetical protein